MIPQNIQANAAVAVDVGVVNARCELDLGGLEGVVCREVDGKEEDASLVRRIGRAHDCRLPVEEVIADGAGAADGARWGVM